jgi:hypothetical protein
VSPDWEEQVRRLVDGLRGLLGEAAASGGGAGIGSDCRWCPVCQVVAVVRGERPEVSTALADVLTSTANTLRALAESPAAPPSAPPAEPSVRTDDDEAGAPPPEVQRVEIA